MCHRVGWTWVARRLSPCGAISLPRLILVALLTLSAGVGVTSGCGVAQSDPVGGPAGFAADPNGPFVRHSPDDSSNADSSNADAANADAGGADGGASRDASSGNQSGASSGVAGAEQVRDAARRTAALPTARYLLTLSWQGDGGASPVLQVEGQVDLGARRSSAVVRQWLAAGPPGEVFGADPSPGAPDGGLSPGPRPQGPGAVAEGPTEVVVDGRWLYIRSGPLGEVAGTGSAWLRLATGPDDQPAPAAVTGLLTLLDRAVSADQAVPDTVSGASARRLRVVLAGLAPDAAGNSGSTVGQSGAGDLGGFAVIGDQVLVWVGDDGLVRAVEAVVLDSAAGRSPDDRRLILRYELVEVGGVVDITVPPADEVVDVAGGS